MLYRGEHLFVYGTLLLPQIMRQVTGQRHFSQTVTLHNYERYGIRSKSYPGIVPQQGASVAGLLYLNLAPVAWRRLDAYEDHFYERQYVPVETVSASVLHAWTYVVPENKRHLLGQHAWSLTCFEARHLNGFLQHIYTRHRP